MKQSVFVARHQAQWQALQQWLDTPPDRRNAAQTDRFAAHYRRLCQHLALAGRRGYSPQLVSYLQDLMQRGHAELYRTPALPWYHLPYFLIARFPRTVRAHAGAMAVAALLFWLPLLATLLVVQWRPDLAYSLADPATLATMETMYDSSAERIGRDSGSDWKMFGHYIMNNISIGLRTFASGLLLGIGSLVVLLVNGVGIGTVAGHLTVTGHGGPFWQFVCGHAPLELTAIVLAGGAGLQLGMRVLAPGRMRRADALAKAGREGAVLVTGVALMLLGAAFIEAFWSSQVVIPATIKYLFSAFGWLIVAAWLLLGGRGDSDAH